MNLSCPRIPCWLQCRRCDKLFSIHEIYLSGICSYCSRELTLKQTWEWVEREATSWVHTHPGGQEWL